SDGAAPRTLWPREIALRSPVPSRRPPLRSSRRAGSGYPPIASAGAGNDPAAGRTPPRRPRSPGCWRGAPPPLAVAPGYRLPGDACARLPSCQDRSHEAPLFRGFDTLAVDDRGAGADLSPRCLPELIPQPIVDPLPEPLPSPAPVVIVDCAPTGKVVG